MSRNLVVVLCVMVFGVAGLAGCKAAQKPPVHTHTSSLDPFDEPERFINETGQSVEIAQKLQGLAQNNNETMLGTAQNREAVRRSLCEARERFECIVAQCNAVLAQPAPADSAGVEANMKWNLALVDADNIRASCRQRLKAFRKTLVAVEAAIQKRQQQELLAAARKGRH